MKKLAFLGAIAASACALAEVTSSNVVGYQAKKVTNGGLAFNFMCGQFNPRIGQDIKTASMKLGDISANNWDWQQDSLKTLTRTAGISADYTYVDEAMAKDWTTQYGLENFVAGWYFVEDVKDESITDFAKYNKNEVELPMTQGFSVQMFSTDGEILFAGEVLAADQPITFNGGLSFNFTGNFSPADLTLGDIVMSDDWDWQQDSLKLLTKTFGIEAEYTYVTQKMATEWTTEYGLSNFVPGWYRVADLKDESITDFAEYQKNSIAIPAGQAFSIQTFSTATTLTIPTALPAATQD